MRVTVVVCTYNRADGLRDTLECLRHQHHDAFEVVVVNGPSTDHTPDVLGEYGEQVRVVENPLANLSVSRNLGIGAAAGEIVAFIDDDALPEPDWLAQALPAFADPEVAGVGGIVFDHTGMDLQYRYSAANRFGEAEYRHTRPYDDQCRPGTFTFPYLQGTNALFRRDALAHVGLFDETYDYYHDETDLCVRLVDAGFVLRQLADAPVHHKFLPSHVRNADRVVTNWYPIIRNHTYFGYRHALDHATELQVIERASAVARRFVDDAFAHEATGLLPSGEGARCEHVAGDALAAGIDLGRRRGTSRLPPVRLDPPPFSRYPTVEPAAHRRRLVLVSSGYPPAVTGGIARYIGEVAPALAAAGHEVRVVTRGSDGGTVDLEDGVWVHRIDVEHAGPGVLADAPDYIDAFASGVADELERMSAWTSPDLVYGPAWDVEVLGVARSVPLPVVVFLATPLDIVAEQSALLDDPHSGPLVRRLLELERELFRTADLAHADSEAVLATITDRYGDLIDPARAGVALLGLADRPTLDPPAREARRFLFVGRLEPRKGIDTLLDAFAAVAADRPDIELTVVGADGVPPGGDGRTYAERFLADHEGEPAATQVRFVGRVDDEDLERWHDWADCLVLPSRYESFGLTMLHAMLTNRAVISCAVGAIPEVVRDGIDGLLVSPGDPAALASAISRIVDEPGLAQTLAAAGRSRYEDAFAIGRSADALLELFARVRLEDAASVVGDLGTALDLRGHPAVRVDAGHAFTIHDDGGSSRSLLVSADGDAAEIAVLGPGVEPVTARIGASLHRVPLPAGDTRIEIVAGGAVVAGTIVVEPETSACD